MKRNSSYLKYATTLKSFQCPYPECTKVCRNANGLKQHINISHPILSSDDSENEDCQPYTIRSHPILTALPVDEKGNFVPKYTTPSPLHTLPSENPWAPFNDRLSFDWAHYHFVELQSSISEINKGLDLWLAAKIEATKDPDCEHLPWESAEELYRTVDEIRYGNTPFTMIHLNYSGPLPPNPPSWMTQSYEFCVRDTRQVLHHQLATLDFKNEFNPTPYQQFQSNGDRIWSNLLSGDWAWQEADQISKEVENSKGCMLVPIVSGLDKTTVSVATGHQEYHPFYFSPGNLTNVARCGHGNGVIPVAFLPIPKASKREKKKKIYQQFVRRLYHTCIARIFEPLRAGMTTPEIVQCPDGYFRWAIYSIGPVIADYPEQVWLSAIVQGWCPKCMAQPEALDDPLAKCRTHDKTDALIQCFDPGILWDNFGVCDDIIPFTYNFPRADIHQLMAPDLLHQVIKGTFKDHLVSWVIEYIHHVNGETQALEIIADIDHRISAVPIFPGLRRFKEGRNFVQWTGDDTKALMKVYLAAIVGYIPDEIVKCLAAFLEVCYIFRRNAITSTALHLAKLELMKFHTLREIFVETGTRTSCSLPRQHGLSHFITSVPLFGSPNGLCSSITESRHITAVKEPWRRSNRYNALSQMLVIITRLDKLAAMRSILMHRNMLQGTTAMHMALAVGEGVGSSPKSEDYYLTICENDSDEDNGPNKFQNDQDDRLDDIGPVSGPRLASSVMLASIPERYPKTLSQLATYISEPQFEHLFLEHLFTLRHPTREIPADPSQHIRFVGKIHVFHSAVARFYAPSDACGAGGMQRQIIRCNPMWGSRARMDTVFVAQNDEPGMPGMLIAQLRLLFSFTDPYTQSNHSCALVNWFPTVGDEPDPVTGMWMVEREVCDDVRPLQVISLDTIVRGAHLLPVFGHGRLPEGFSYTDSLEAFKNYFVNPYIDHHAHELLSVT